MNILTIAPYPPVSTEISSSSTVMQKSEGHEAVDPEELETGAAELELGAAAELDKHGSTRHTTERHTVGECLHN